jgi:hypothetical protein
MEMERQVLWNQIYEKDLEPALGKSLAEQLATEKLVSEASHM